MIIYFSIFLIFLTFNILGSDSKIVETCDSPPLKSSIFCNKKFSLIERVDYLINLLTTKEKISLLTRFSPGIERFNISEYNWRCEALHGLGLSTCEYGNFKVVSYPQVINLGRTFDVESINTMAKQISSSARALFNAGQFRGLSMFSPTLNVIVDPRWGRLQENAGECPYLISEYAKAYIKGMKDGKDPRYFKTIPTAKHFTAYHMEDWTPLKNVNVDRYHFDAIVSDQDLVETYNYPFYQAVVEGGVTQIMCSYNAINHVPACANDFLINNVTRNEWGFGDGVFVGDNLAIQFIYQMHKYAKSIAEAVAFAIKAGVDLADEEIYIDYLEEALEKKLISENDLSKSARRMIYQRMRLGEFDSPLKSQYYYNIDTSVINNNDNKELSYKLAVESIVLLENMNNILPLSKSNEIKRVAVVGPNGNATRELMGSYIGPTDKVQSIYDVLKEDFEHVLYEKGCDIVSTSKDDFEKAKLIVQESDLTVIVMGLNQSIEKEHTDRYSLELNGIQNEFISYIKQYSKGPAILVLVKAGPIDISSHINKVDAIIDAGYPSQFGARALIDIIKGVHSPSGRMTYTTYKAEYAWIVPMTNMRMRADVKTNYPGRTYRFYNGNPVYPFGYGLSYTKFKYEWMEEEEEEEEGKHLIFSLNEFENQYFRVKVTNIGNFDSSVSVLAYVSNIDYDFVRKDAPIKQLFAFKRIENLKIGQSTIIYFDKWNKDMFSYVNQDGKRKLLKGNYVVKIENLEKKIKII